MANERARLVEFRAQPRGIEIREADDGQRVMLLDLIRFNEWTEINSRLEGRFLERIAPGAATKTIDENRDQMRVLFNHGRDPAIGEKPIGPIRNLWADDDAVRAEVPLLRTSYNGDIEELLSADPPVLGASFRFEVTREDRKRRPGKSDYNPNGLDERTIREFRMGEFGPVTFPAYAGTSAGVRSVTDDYTPPSVYFPTGIAATSSAGGAGAGTLVTLGARALAERVDSYDLSILAQMLMLGANYCDEQDEAEDAAGVTKMHAILEMIEELVPVEIAEDEPAEPEDDTTSSKDGRAGEGSASVDAPDDGNAGRARDHLAPSRRAPVTLDEAREEKPEWRL